MNLKVLSALAILTGFALSSHGTILVNDNWSDAIRTDPNSVATPPYAENNGLTGTDADSDGTLESAWFANPGAGLVATAGHLTGSPAAAASASWTTYFTDTFGHSVNLANVGDTMKITWIFTPTTVAANNNGQNFRLAVVQSPSGGRLAADATPASQIYAGYGMFGNMGTTLGRAAGDNFNLMEWTVPGGANNILSTTAAYTKIAGDASALNNTGYIDGTPYTFTFTAQRVATGIQLDETITGGSLNGTGGLTNSLLDTTPSTFTFDTFALRPSTGASTALTFDTTQFKVEFTGVPEPSVFALSGMALLGLAAVRRKLLR